MIFQYERPFIEGTDVRRHVLYESSLFYLKSDNLNSIFHCERISFPIELKHIAFRIALIFLRWSS